MNEQQYEAAERASNWRQRAACHGADPNTFFPSTDEEQKEVVGMFCASCAVRDECLNYAFVTNQDDGVWGATTERQRRRLRKAWLDQQRRS